MFVLNINLKKILKVLKLNETNISVFLGVVVVLTIGIFAIKYINGSKGSIPQELLENQNSVEAQYKVHKVQKGENLWNIAVKYYGDGFKWVDIATENKLKNASIIEKDQELVIPNIEEKSVKNANLDSSVKNTTINSDKYEVVKGDTLWSIAIRAYGDGYKWTLIAKENKLAHPGTIHPGNILILPR